jgi:hypothetical protein
MRAGFSDRDRGGSQRRLHSKSLRRIAEFSGPPEIKRRKFYIAGGNFKLIKAPLAGPAGSLEARPETRSELGWKLGLGLGFGWMIGPALVLGLGIGPTAAFEEAALDQNQARGIEPGAHPGGLEQLDPAAGLGFSVEFALDDDFGGFDPGVDTGGSPNPEQIRGDHLAIHAAIDPTGRSQREKPIKSRASAQQARGGRTAIEVV